MLRRQPSRAAKDPTNRLKFILQRDFTTPSQTTLISNIKKKDTKKKRKKKNTKLTKVLRKTKPTYKIMVTESLIELGGVGRSRVSLFALSAHIESHYPVPESFRNYIRRTLKEGVEDKRFRRVNNASYAVTPKGTKILTKKKKGRKTSRKQNKKKKKKNKKNTRKTTNKKKNNNNNNNNNKVSTRKNTTISKRKKKKTKKSSTPSVVITTTATTTKKNSKRTERQARIEARRARRAGGGVKKTSALPTLIVPSSTAGAISTPTSSPIRGGGGGGRTNMLDLEIESNSTPAGYSHVWQFLGRKTGWHNYDIAASDVVEGAYQEFLVNPGLCDVRSIQSGKFNYQVDFLNLKQTNIAHTDHTVRSIRRIPKADS